MFLHGNCMLKKYRWCRLWEHRAKVYSTASQFEPRYQLAEKTEKGCICLCLVPRQDCSEFSHLMLRSHDIWLWAWVWAILMTRITFGCEHQSKQVLQGTRQTMTNIHADSNARSVVFCHLFFAQVSKAIRIKLYNHLSNLETHKQIHVWAIFFCKYHLKYAFGGVVGVG